MKRLVTIQRQKPLKILAVLYLILLLTLTHLPKVGSLPDLPGKDKTLHVLAYFTAAVLVLAGFLKKIRMGQILAFIAALLLFGAIDEWTQPWCNRCCDFYDWLGDATGIIAGTLLLIHVCDVKEPTAD